MSDIVEVVVTSESVVEASTPGPPGPQGPVGPQGPAGPPGGGSALYGSGVPDATLSVETGGSLPEPASVWKTRTISEALDTILFPTIPPSISAFKSASLSTNLSNVAVREVGQGTSNTLTAIFNQGFIVNGDNTNGPALVGPALSYTFTGTGISSPIVSTLPTSSLFSTIQLGTNQWQVTVAHSAGTGVYFDNKGNADSSLDSSRVAGSAVASTSPITGVYPWYVVRSPIPFTDVQFGAAITELGGNNIGGSVSGIAGATISKNVSNAANNMTIPYNVNGVYLGVAYQSSIATKTQYYVTALDNGSINSIFSPVTTVSTNTNMWSAVYKIHISPTPLTNSNSTITLS